MKQPTKAQLREELEVFRKVAKDIKQSLLEAATLNMKSGKLISLLVDFDLKHDEKVNIVKQFIDVDTVSDANELYIKIKEELKNRQKEENNEKHETLFYTR